MKVAYRRMSGPIGFSDLEAGTRGLWLEKRRAFVMELRRRGHQVDIFNRMTKFSQQLTTPTFNDSYDVLFIEFGSSNLNFYHDDLNKTQRLTREHGGKIVFLCDDPDLPYLWRTLKADDFEWWAVWANATKCLPFGGQPAAIKTFDFPFASLLPMRRPQDVYGDKFVYIGRPNGRAAAFTALHAAHAPYQVYGRTKEWPAAINVLDPPEQNQRTAFYAKQLGSLVIADNKHKQLGWRTGRAYHAIAAGCPAVVEKSHTVLSNMFADFTLPGDLENLRELWSVPGVRREICELQQAVVEGELKIAAATFESVGL